jgi:hypothetical protein
MINGHRMMKNPRPLLGVRYHEQKDDRVSCLAFMLGMAILVAGILFT